MLHTGRKEKTKQKTKFTAKCGTHARGQPSRRAKSILKKSYIFTLQFNTYFSVYYSFIHDVCLPSAQMGMKEKDAWIQESTAACTNFPHKKYHEVIKLNHLNGL